MENWGLVMYRETALLYDPTVNSESNKASVARIIAHELSHQVKFALDFNVLADVFQW